jgi:hypothetical protein
VKRVASSGLLVLLGLALTGPVVLHANPNSAQTEAQKKSQKEYKKYSKQQAKAQKKQFKAQKKQMKKWNKQHQNTTTTVT